MSGQTSYSQFQPIAVAGMMANSDSTDDGKGSYAATETIAFGRAVAFTGDETVRLTAAAGDVTSGLFAGFAVLDTSKVTQTGYLQYEVVCVLREGEIYCETIDSSAIGGAVYVVTTAGVNRGKVSSDSGSGSLLPRAKFLTTTGAAGLCVVSFDAR